MPEIIKLLFNENHVSVELDNSEILRISYDVYSQYKLSSGMDISGDFYMEIFDESRKFECRNKGLSYLGLRARSVNEIKKYLKKKNFADKHIDDAVEYLKSKGYLNDHKFAIMYTKDRMKSGKRGKDLIAQDLFRKGISRKEIDRAIKECGADIPDEDSIYKLAVQKFESVKHKENPEIKVASYLRQRGFDYDVIRKVMKKINNDFDE